MTDPTALRVLLATASVLLPLAVFGGSCASNPGSDGATSFVACESDSDCEPGEVCGPNRRCVARSTVDASSSSDAASIADAALTWPACTIPASLAPLDGSRREACGAARTMLSCGDPGGGGSFCLSDDPTRCPNGTGPTGTCVAECEEHEYAAACGGVGPGTIPDPPAGCRFWGAIPAGTAFYCCPCGGDAGSEVTSNACGTALAPATHDGGLSIQLDPACCNALSPACAPGENGELEVLSALGQACNPHGYDPNECATEVHMEFDQSGCLIRVSHDAVGHPPDDAFVTCIAGSVSAQRWPCLAGGEFDGLLTSCTQ